MSQFYLSTLNGFTLCDLRVKTEIFIAIVHLGKQHELAVLQL